MIMRRGRRRRRMKTRNVMRGGFPKSCDLGKHPHRGELNAPGYPCISFVFNSPDLYPWRASYHICASFMRYQWPPPGLSSDPSQAGCWHGGWCNILAPSLCWVFPPLLSFDILFELNLQRGLSLETETPPKLVGGHVLRVYWDYGAGVCRCPQTVAPTDYPTMLAQNRGLKLCPPGSISAAACFCKPSWSELLACLLTCWGGRLLLQHRIELLHGPVAHEANLVYSTGLYT